MTLARHLAADDVTVVEVARPNQQVRRQHGKTDVVDAIAAARTHRAECFMPSVAAPQPRVVDGVTLER